MIIVPFFPSLFFFSPIPPSFSFFQVKLASEQSIPGCLGRVIVINGGILGDCRGNPEGPHTEPTRGASSGSPAPPVDLWADSLCSVPGHRQIVRHASPFSDLHPPCLIRRQQTAEFRCEPRQPCVPLYFFSDRLGCPSDRISVKTRTGLQRGQRWNNRRTTTARELRNSFHKMCAKKKPHVGQT